MADGRGGFARDKTTGQWIRDHLTENAPAYVGELHRAFVGWCEQREYSPPSYASFRRTVWLLKEEGLLEVERTEPGKNPALADRHYYRVRPSADADDPAWTDPVRERYGRDDGE